MTYIAFEQGYALNIQYKLLWNFIENCIFSSVLHVLIHPMNCFIKRISHVVLYSYDENILIIGLIRINTTVNKAVAVFIFTLLVSKILLGKATVVPRKKDVHLLKAHLLTIKQLIYMPGKQVKGSGKPWQNQTISSQNKGKRHWSNTEVSYLRTPLERHISFAIKIT